MTRSKSCKGKKKVISKSKRDSRSKTLKTDNKGSSQTSRSPSSKKPTQKVTKEASTQSKTNSSKASKATSKRGKKRSNSSCSASKKTRKLNKRAKKTQTPRQGKRKTQKSRKKDKKKRTHPPNAFIIFCAEVRVRLKERDPTIKVTEVARRAGECWRKLSQETKDEYRKKACGNPENKGCERCPLCKQLLPK